MFKYTVLFLVCWVLLPDGLTLECWICSTACDISQATLNTQCGSNARRNLDAFCTSESLLPDGSGNNSSSTLRIRRCLLSEKGTDPDCPEGRDCTYCMSDKCNDGNNNNDNDAPTRKNNENTTTTGNGNVITANTNTNVNANVNNRTGINVGKRVTSNDISSVATSMLGSYFSFTTVILFYFFVNY